MRGEVRVNASEEKGEKETVSTLLKSVERTFLMKGGEDLMPAKKKAKKKR